MQSDENEAAAALRGRVVAVVNTAGGGADATSADQMRALFAAAGLTNAEVVSATPGDLEASLDQAAAQADVLVVLGGDGTIRTAVEKARSRRVHLAPLPGGTMNMLPRAIYGERTWQAALTDSLAAPATHLVGGGRAGPYVFFVAALLGAPTLWADAREAVREGRLLEAVRRAVTAARRSRGEPLTYAFGPDARGAAEAVVVICPLVSRAMDESERCLEAAAIGPEGAAEALRLGFHAIFDDWRADPSVTRTKVRWARVTGHGPVPVILDGEKVRLGRIVDLEYVPVAFRALVPAADPAPPSTPAAATPAEG
jgi:diacylglycerol kinase family enzyme